MNECNPSTDVSAARAILLASACNRALNWLNILPNVLERLKIQTSESISEHCWFVYSKAAPLLAFFALVRFSVQASLGKFFHQVNAHPHVAWLTLPESDGIDARAYLILCIQSVSIFPLSIMKIITSMQTNILYGMCSGSSDLNCTRNYWNMHEMWSRVVVHAP